MLPGSTQSSKKYNCHWTEWEALYGAGCHDIAALLEARNKWWRKSKGEWWDDTVTVDRKKRTLQAQECPALRDYGKHHKVCRQIAACPFCWARDVVSPLYKRAAKNVWPQDMRQLYAVCTAVRIDAWPLTDPCNERELANAVTEAAPDSPSSPLKDALWPADRKDAYHIVTLELQSDVLLRTSRCIYRSTQRPMRRPRVATTVAYATTNHEVIARAVARVAAWPHRHLTNDVHLAVLLRRALQRLGKRRLRAGYGAFRSDRN